ncbi:hypothetical protein KVF89_20590 [Nocardioides carbamazepini]|uniref:hypothetical protein n=1 Tax=Nocardioides carbamazepini TaxID=2854259 RepID=UPI00214A7158|nr:hypothetical protein [Nocardioides carbamazepini]MCR1784951.1 hypothetical protein [Nocardioides carbamazepini]
MSNAAEPGRARPVTIEVRTMGRTLDDTDVDRWELKAARRALRNLRTIAAGQPLMDLLADQISEGDRYHKALIGASDGTYRESKAEMTVRGITGTELAEWFRSRFTTGTLADKMAMLFAHPEHYVQPPDFANGGNVEPIGGHLARFKADMGPELPEAVAAFLDPSYPVTLASAVLMLADDTPFAYCLHQARDTEYGSEVVVRVLYSSAAPDAMIEGHCEHLAVEFRSWIRDAAETVTAGRTG